MYVRLCSIQIQIIYLFFVSFIFGTSLHLPEHIPFCCVSVDVYVVFWTFVCLLLIDTVRAASRATNNVWRPPAFDRIVKVKWIHSVDLVVQTQNTHTHKCSREFPLLCTRAPYHQRPMWCATGNYEQTRHTHTQTHTEKKSRKIGDTKGRLSGKMDTIKWRIGVDMNFYRRSAFNIRLKGTKKNIVSAKSCHEGWYRQLILKCNKSSRKLLLIELGAKVTSETLRFGVRQFAMSHYVWIMNNGLKLISWTYALKTYTVLRHNATTSRQQRKLFRKQM